jgi:hypothetical protein
LKAYSLEYQRYLNDRGHDLPMKNDEELYRKRFYHKEIRSKALESALDIRKFEIGLYWQRAAYFWALIAAAFAGHFAILSADHLPDKEFLAFVVGCIGLVFNWAWFLVNRGSKYWQENWENHVDMLEDPVTGPLYKTVLHRPKLDNPFETYIVGPAAVSVSKINQWVSSFSICIWLALVMNAIGLSIHSDRSGLKCLAVGAITVTFGYLMTDQGKTEGNHPPRVMTSRTAGIE